MLVRSNVQKCREYHRGLISKQIPQELISDQKQVHHSQCGNSKKKFQKVLSGVKLYNIHWTSCGTKIFFSTHFHQRHYSSLCWPKSNTDPRIYIFQYCLGILPTEVLTHSSLSLSRQLFYIYSVAHQRISTTALSHSLHTNFISYPLNWSRGRCRMASRSSAQMNKEILSSQATL